MAKAIVDFDAIIERLELLPGIEAGLRALAERVDREHPEYLDYRGAARHLKLGMTTLQQYVSAGTIPHHKIGAAVRFNRLDLDTWMMSKRIDIGGRANVRRASRRPAKKSPVGLPEL